MYKSKTRIENIKKFKQNVQSFIKIQYKILLEQLYFYVFIRYVLLTFQLII